MSQTFDKKNNSSNSVDNLEVPNELLEERQKNSQTKKGDRYNKLEREKKRREAFSLYKEGYSMLEISKKIDVNRHTVEEYIQYIYSQLANEYQDFDYKSEILKQIYILKSQQARLRANLDEEKQTKDKNITERLLLDTTNKLLQIMLKIHDVQKVDRNFSSSQLQEISEDEIKKLCRWIIDNENYDDESCCFNENELLRYIFSYKKCTILDARKIMAKLKLLGLATCRYRGDNNRLYWKPYNIFDFAIMRNYVTVVEVVKHEKEFNDYCKKTDYQFRTNIEILSKKYEVEYDEESRCIFIKDFVLPPGFNAIETEVLIPISELPDNPPTKFYVLQGLITENPDAEMGNYEENVYTYFGREWRKFSIQVDEWNPSDDVVSGDNLLTFMTLVEQKLAEIAKTTSYIFSLFLILAAISLPFFVSEYIFPTF